MKMNTKGRDNYETPPHVYEHLDRIFNFTIDAACTLMNCLAPKGICPEMNEDGLKESWEDQRVFCNPPFSNKAAWIEKAHKEIEGGGCPLCVMILPILSMSNEAWHKYIFGRYHYDILEQRISFINPETGEPEKGNNSGTAIIYFMKKVNVKP